MRIYLRILERSCATNQAFDALFLNDDDDDLAAIAQQLDEDVRTILLRPKDGLRAERKMEKAQKRQQAMERRAQRRLERAGRQRAAEEDNRRGDADADEAAAADDTSTVEDVEVPTGSQRRAVLRVLAGTRRQFRLRAVKVWRAAR